MMSKNFLLPFILVLLGLPRLSSGQETKGESDDLANAIQNPIAALISIPFQNNTDFGYYPGNKARNTLNIQPVVPVGLGSKVNMIVRTIIPLVSAPVPTADGTVDREFGLGDVALSLFFTPARPGKLIWGVGPAIGMPTSTAAPLGFQKWTAGPSVIALVQPKGWTLGGLVQNTWSFGGNGYRNAVNFFYSQFFITRNLPKGWFVNTAPIVTANWNAPSGQQWVVPLGAGFGKLTKIGRRPISWQAGGYYFIVSPDNGPAWELRLQLNLLYPR
jgi:hypothetical protein